MGRAGLGKDVCVGGVPGVPNLLREGPARGSPSPPELQGRAEAAARGLLTSRVPFASDGHGGRRAAGPDSRRRGSGRPAGDSRRESCGSGSPSSPQRAAGRSGSRTLGGGRCAGSSGGEGSPETAPTPGLRRRDGGDHGSRGLYRRGAGVRASGRLGLPAARHRGLPGWRRRHIWRVRTQLWGGGRSPGASPPPAAPAHILFPPAGGRGRLPAGPPAKG